MQSYVSVARRADRARDVALVADTEPRQRQSMSTVLRDAGYAVTLAADAEQLETALGERSIIESPRPLAVLGVALARRCAGALAAVSARRAQAGVPELSIILTYEPETLTTVVRPSLGPCSLVAIFEKPLDLEELRSLAQTARLPEGSPTQSTSGLP